MQVRLAVHEHLSLLATSSYNDCNCEPIVVKPDCTSESDVAFLRFDIFVAMASRFSDCSSWEFELLAAGAGGDLGYTVGIERTTASVAGAQPSAYALRVTTVLRREGGEWKVVHRHGDPYDETAGDLADRIREPRTD